MREYAMPSFTAEALKAGDQMAWESLYSTHHGFFAKVAHSRGVPFEDIDDLLQEGFTRAFKGIESLKDGSNPIAWFTRIIQNTSIDYHRYNGSRISPTSLTIYNEDGEEVEGSAAEDPTISAEEAFIIHEETQAALEKLTPREYVIFVGKSIGSSDQEIGEMVGLQPQSVKTAAFRGRERMKAAS